MIDSRHAGRDAGEVLDGRASGIPVLPDLPAALEQARVRGTPSTHLVVGLARSRGVRLRDVRRPPPRLAMHFFSGKIEEVSSLKVAVLGTDSAVGKRTTTWLLVDAFRCAGMSTVFIGTGQTG